MHRQSNDQDLYIFLRDAHRQASTFSDPISTSTRQIYVYLLRISNEDSIVAKHYSQYARKGFWIEYIGEKLHSDCIKVIDSHYDRVSSVSFSPDGTRVVCGYWDGTVCILDSAGWRTVVGPLEGHERAVTSVTFSPDGRYIVSGSEDGTIIKWDAISGDLIWQSSKLHTS